MTAEATQLTPEQAEQLVGQGDPDEKPSVLGGAAEVVPIPCKIMTVQNGQFVVQDVGAWAYTPYGVFATGYWAFDLGTDGKPNDGVEEQDNLFPYNNVSYITYDYAAYLAFIEQAKAAALTQAEQAEPEEVIEGEAEEVTPDAEPNPGD